LPGWYDAADVLDPALRPAWLECPESQRVLLFRRLAAGSEQGQRGRGDQCGRTVPQDGRALPATV